MRTTAKAFVFAMLLVVSMYAGAQVVDQWDTLIIPATPHNATIYRGETYNFQPRLFYNGAAWNIPSNSVACFYWTTNNWASAPFSNVASVVLSDTGRVSAVWSNSMDFGSTFYRYFIGISEPSGLVYRISGQINMQASPGWQPSPTTWPVWDGWTNNYIYATYAALLGMSNSLVYILQPQIAAITNRTLTINGQTGSLSSNLSFTVVASVFGRTGVVVATSGDYTSAQVGAVATNDARYLAALTNPAQFATSAQGAKADAALQSNGSGSLLTGITAAQVGAVATNDARYLSALTNAAAFDAAGAASSVSNWSVATLYPRSNPSNWITAAQVPAQTNQGYAGQSGTAQVAIVATTVTGSQSNIIAGAVTNGQASLTINGPGTFGGDLSVGGSLYVVNVTVSNTQVVATNLTVNGVVSNGGYRIAQGGLLYSGGNAVLTNGATVTQGTYADGWHAVSNTVQVGAALGATALQSEVDTLASVTARGNITTGDIQMQYGNSSIWFGNGGLQRIWGGAFDFQIFDGVGRRCADFYNSGISASNFSSTISGKTNAITSSGLVDLSSALGAAGSALQPNGSASGLSGCPSGAVATNDTRYLGSVTNAVGSTSTNVSIWTGTAASYAALTATNANCIYFVE
jgi:hypothetical protein